MSELIARPLFAQTRRPPPRAPVHTQSPSPPPVATTNGMVLLGVLNTGAKAVALVTVPGQSRPYLVTVGDKLGDWKITSIKPDRILLRTGDTTGMLSLPAAAPVPTTQNSPFYPHNFSGFTNPQ